MQDTMSSAIRNAQDVLEEHLDGAAIAMECHASRAEVTQKTDDFLIRACRHASAFCDVMLPAARAELPDGRGRVREYVRQCRRLERATAQTRRRLYGDSSMMATPWSHMWSGLSRELRRLNDLERRLGRDLIDRSGAGRHDELALRLEAAETVGPTRPHPNSRHSGSFSHLSRRVWARVDTFWDATQGRIVSKLDPVESSRP